MCYEKKAKVTLSFPKPRCRTRGRESVQTHPDQSTLSLPSDVLMADSDPTAMYFIWWNVLGSPAEEDWNGADGTVSVIRKQLNLPVGSRKQIVNTFMQASKAHREGQP